MTGVVGCIIFCLVLLTGVVGIHLINGSNEVAHIEDSVNLIGTTISNLFNNGSLTAITGTPDSCEKRVEDEKWEDGMDILE